MFKNITGFVNSSYLSASPQQSIPNTRHNSSQNSNASSNTTLPGKLNLAESEVREKE
jgi:hypothetical protein